MYHQIIKYVNIKILQVHLCPQLYLDFNVTFSRFYLFDWKFVDLMVFSFSLGKLCAPEKSGATWRFCAPDRYRECNLSRPEVGPVDIQNTKTSTASLKIGKQMI